MLTPAAVRTELEILARAWARPVARVGLGLVLAGTAIAQLEALSPYAAEPAYVLALLCAGLTHFVLSGQERAAWSRPSSRQDLLFVVAVGGACAASTLALQLTQLALGTHILQPSALIGCAHLAALALVTRRAPLNPAARTLVFLGSATVLPALLPILRPLLDASPSFHTEHFSPWIEALAPILSLIVIAVALPSRARLALVGETSA